MKNILTLLLKGVSNNEGEKVNWDLMVERMTSEQVRNNYNNYNEYFY